jgi:hypothetical protein
MRFIVGGTGGEHLGLKAAAGDPRLNHIAYPQFVDLAYDLIVFARDNGITPIKRREWAHGVQRSTRSIKALAARPIRMAPRLTQSLLEFIQALCVLT